MLYLNLKVHTIVKIWTRVFAVDTGNRPCPVSVIVTSSYQHQQFPWQQGTHVMFSIDVGLKLQVNWREPAADPDDRLCSWEFQSWWHHQNGISSSHGYKVPVSWGLFKGIATNPGKVGKNHLQKKWCFHLMLVWNSNSNWSVYFLAQDLFVSA